jgi:hypothetical protein
MAVLIVHHPGHRPGPVDQWHVHGWTTKDLWILDGLDGPLLTIRLIKRRWKHVATDSTVHSRPCWDLPYRRFGLDVMTVALFLWLFGEHGLHRAKLPWSRPEPRTLQRWAAALAPHARRWLQQARAQFLDLVAPRHLEEVMPAGGIPPPAARFVHRDSFACRLGDVVWTHNQTAQSLCMPIRQLLVVARWRWPETYP